MDRQHLRAFATMLITVIPAIPAAMLIWILAFNAAIGWNQDRLVGLAAVIWVVGNFAAIGLGGAVGAVSWLRLIRRRVTPEVAWYWLTRGTPPFRIAHRLNSCLFTLGWGSAPPDAS